MGRVYVVSGSNLTVGTGNVLIALQTAAAGSAGSILQVRRIEISQSGTTTGEMVRPVLSTRNTSGTLTTTIVTPANLTLGGPASGLSGNTSVIGGTGRIGINSSADSGGTYTDIWPGAFYNLGGNSWILTPPEQLIIPPSIVFCVKLNVSPTGTGGWHPVLVYEELY